MPIVDDIAGLRRILMRSRTLAVVGLSAQWYRPSYFAAKYMQDHGYRIIPVNPKYAEVLGEKCYPDLRSIPQPVDRRRLLPQGAGDSGRSRDEAIAIGAKVLWMQLGIVNDEAAQRAMRRGLDVVMNRCVKIEHARILGGLNWAGVNTGRDLRATTGRFLSPRTTASAHRRDLHPMTPGARRIADARP